VGETRDSLAVIPGNVPNLIDLPPACRFAPRCLTREVEDVVDSTLVHPNLLDVAPGHEVRCWLYHDREGRVIRDAAPPSFAVHEKVVSERGTSAVIGGTPGAAR
jgi:oligopeptide/dipeptide ABC transporter ATP-binding protein